MLYYPQGGDIMNPIIDSVTAQLSQMAKEEPLFSGHSHFRLPRRHKIIAILQDIRKIIFPGYFLSDDETLVEPTYYIGDCLSQLNLILTKEIYSALKAAGVEGDAHALAGALIEKLPQIQQMILLDVQACFDGDPAARGRDEIVFCYPGLFATLVYRVAHELYKLNVPFIPRIMTEYAHNETGIDIHAGAVIGSHFMIDHGTGIVIGETCVIGNHVRIYQGVTLGAISTRGGQRLAGVKRHPTIEDNVTIYSNASILGGDTVIGANCVIGGSAFITSSVPANTRVAVAPPELNYSMKK